MTAPEDRAGRLNAARLTGQQIVELIEETRLVACWHEDTGRPNRFGTELSQFRLHMVQVLLAQIVQLCDNPTDGSWLADAQAAGHQIAKLIRGREGPWWKDLWAGPALLLCLRLAEYLASAESPDEAEQFVMLLEQAVGGASPALDPAGDSDRLQAARATGRHIADMIKESDLGGWKDAETQRSYKYCLRMAHYLATATTEVEAEMFSRLLAQAISRHTQRIGLAAVGDPAARLEVAHTIGRQVTDMIKRTDLIWLDNQPVSRLLEECIELAGKLADAASEVDAERFATALGQALRRGSPALAAHRPALSSDLHAMASQTDRIAHGFVSGGRQWLDGTQISSERELPPVVHQTVRMFVAVDYRTPKELVSRWSQGSHDPGRLIRWLLQLAVSIVPVPVRARYAEEYGAEIWHLRIASPRHRILHAVRLASRACQVRISLRKTGTTLWTMPPDRN